MNVRGAIRSSLGIVLLFGVGLSAQEVKTDYDRGVRKTFEHFPPEAGK